MITTTIDFSNASTKEDMFEAVKAINEAAANGTLETTKFKYGQLTPPPPEIKKQFDQIRTERNEALKTDYKVYENSLLRLGPNPFQAKAAAVGGGCPDCEQGPKPAIDCSGESGDQKCSCIKINCITQTANQANSDANNEAAKKIFKLITEHPDLAQWLLNAYNKLLTAISKIIKRVLSWLVGIVKRIINWVSGVWNDIKNFFRNLFR